MNNSIIDLTQQSSPFQKKIKKPIKFQYLDSLRGLLCLNVVLIHAGQLITIQSSSLKYYFHTTLAFAVPGFFLLSAFLLTYRLLLELFNFKSTDIRSISKILTKYSIRRFFRIYPLLIIFIVFIKLNIYIYPGDAGTWVALICGRFRLK